ncbi:PLDc N-terminal domain-containing protein [Neptunomonas antarctica]|uniref:Phospholipase_D-nuclease N-terminal n=1 Tax=Neptunomonas antarctica TaxID=619304 RepID=A0A1N7NEF1_9GAMM|nr:PLDc N-terminal domain-containing protein [Neptunomonas antarctica]SIS96648.1 Phospholipase_D-nuclease N-terminal [Neptunomonas antarctica]
MGIEVSGILGLLILVFDIWAIIQAMQSSATTGSKILWVLLILFLPVLGFVFWLFLGPGRKKI